MANGTAVSVEAYQGRRVLITGAGGYIGGRLVQTLAATDCLIRRHSRNPPPGWNSDARLESCGGDPLSEQTWREALRGIDIVFHCAGQTSVYVADHDPLVDLTANVGMTLALLEAARHCADPVTIVLASTATIAGLAEILPVDESTPPAPVTAYDSSKLAAEHYLALYTRLGFVRGGALRLANVYGPGPDSSSADRGVLNKIVARSLRGEPIQLFRPGDWLRDYVFIDDVVDAFLKAGLAGQAMEGKPYYVCTGNSIPLGDAFREAIAAAARVTGVSSTMTWIDPPTGLSPIEFRNFAGRSDALRAVSGWRPATALDEGLDRTAAALSVR